MQIKKQITTLKSVTLVNDFNNALNAIPSTKELVRIYNLETNKKLGQNFLLDDTITDKILFNLPSIKDKTILEVGAGPGGLTRSILACHPKKLYAIEYDHRCIPILELIKTKAPDVLEIIQADALKFDENSIGIGKDEKISIIANLPYNIGSGLVLRWLHNMSKFEFIVVMLQKEVALRLAAKVGDQDYSRLSIVAQSVADVDIMFELGPKNFYPPPKVGSAVVRLIPKSSEKTVNLKLLGKVTQVAFNLRRKKIKTSLASILSESDFEQLSLDVNKRAEELTLQDYLSITNFIEAKSE